MLSTPVAESDDEQIHLHTSLLDAAKQAILAIRIQIPQKGGPESFSAGTYNAVKPIVIMKPHGPGNSLSQFSAPGNGPGFRGCEQQLRAPSEFGPQVLLRAPSC